MLKILLLTCMGADNVGDQMIETCAAQLTRCALSNLEVVDYTIDSHDIDRVDENIVPNYNLIIFGGGGIIKFKYQSFYKRIACIVTMAHYNNIPILFNAVGIEGYNDRDFRCRILKENINKTCVKQITTRDDLETLEKYIINEDIKIAHVVDPAVFTNYVLGESQVEDASTIGLCVVRGGIFKANGKTWTEKEEIAFWVGVIGILEAKGYDFKLFTTGHFSDEVFMLKVQNILRLNDEKIVPVIYNRRKLVDVLKHMKGIIAFRLHAGIISYSLGVPAINLEWNDKVKYFYESIGMPERSLAFSDWNPEMAVARLEAAMLDRKEQLKDIEFMMTTYTTLYSGLKNILFAQGVIDETSKTANHPYSFAELINEKHLLVEGREIDNLLEQAERKLYAIEKRYLNLDLKKQFDLRRFAKKYAKRHSENLFVIMLLRLYSSVRKK